MRVVKDEATKFIRPGQQHPLLYGTIRFCLPMVSTAPKNISPWIMLFDTMVVTQPADPNALHSGLNLSFEGNINLQLQKLIEILVNTGTCQSIYARLVLSSIDAKRRKVIGHNWVPCIFYRIWHRSNVCILKIYQVQKLEAYPMILPHFIAR